MAKQILLHIGLEKTGTTTLQAAAGASRDLLASQGILYPRSPGQANHTALAIYASAGGKLSDLRRLAGLAEDAEFMAFQARFPAELRQEIEASGCDRVWLSNEHLSSRIRLPVEIARLAQLLKPLAAEIRIIVYLRNQPDLLLSSYSTFIRSGGVRDLMLPRSDRDYFYNFAMMLHRWSEHFAPAALTVRIFDRSLLKHGDIIADFLETIGAQPDPTMGRKADLNRSLDADAIKFLRGFNGHVQRLTPGGLNPEYGAIGSILEKLSTGPKFTPPESMIRQIVDMFAVSNDHVARRYFRAKAGPLFQPHAFTREATPPTLHAETARALGCAVLRELDMEILKAERLAEVETGPGRVDAASVRAAQTAEAAIEATAILWRHHQMRLVQLRAMRHHRAVRALG